MTKQNVNICTGCGEGSSDCIRNQKCQVHKDLIFCEECGAGFYFEHLSDDNVETYREYHGQPNLTPEIVPVAWTCPECGHYQRL